MDEMTVGRVVPAFSMTVPMPKGAKAPREEGIEFQIGRLALGPDDVLVVRSKEKLSLSYAERIREKVATVVGSAHRVLVLEGGLELAVLTRAEIEAKSEPVPMVYRFLGKELSELAPTEREMARKWCQETIDGHGWWPNPGLKQAAQDRAKRFLEALTRIETEARS